MLQENVCRKKFMVIKKLKQQPLVAVASTNIGFWKGSYYWENKKKTPLKGVFFYKVYTKD